MAEPEGKGVYADFIAKPHRSLLEVRWACWVAVSEPTVAMGVQC